MENLSQYLVRSPKQVMSYLNLLSTERCLVSAGFGESDKDTFLTAIMDINEKEKTITLDCGPKEYLNKRLLDSAIIKCSTEYKGIKVHFEGRKVKKAGSPADPSFIIPIPNSIFWVQRRQFYRIRSPLSKNSFCKIPFINPETQEQTVLTLRIHDLSASGISIVNDSIECSSLLIPEVEIDNCTLSLEDEFDLKVSLEVRHKMSTNPNKKGKEERIGCYISNATPRIESTILRYMQRIERDLKQKEL